MLLKKANLAVASLVATSLFVACGQENSEDTSSVANVNSSNAPKLIKNFWETQIAESSIKWDAGLRCKVEVSLTDFRNTPSDTEFDFPRGFYSQTVVAGNDIDSKIPNPFPVELVTTHSTRCVSLGYLDSKTQFIECQYNPATKAVNPNYVKIQYSSKATQLQTGIGSFKQTFWVVPAQVIQRGRKAAARCVVRM
jgi:hypothetical protein